MSSIALLVLIPIATASTATTAFDFTADDRGTPTVARVAEPDAFRYAPYAALVDGGWSIVMTVAWALSARAWTKPQLEGALGVTMARVLYGTTWSVQVAVNAAILRLATGENWDGVSQGSLRNHWLIGLDIPAPCERGGGGFCGVGLGAYSEIALAIDEDPATDTTLELAMTGGWIQGRFDADQRRTLMESTWVQAPIIARARWQRSFGPISFETVLGGGLYYGMHNAHVHGTAENTLDVPAWELVVLEAGAGVGAHAKFSVTLFDVVSFEAEGDLAPFFLAIRPERPAVVGPLDNGRDGQLVWRRAAVGIGMGKDVLPIRLALRVFGLDLGGGPIGTVGHKGVVLQFDTPFGFDADQTD